MRPDTKPLPSVEMRPLTPERWRNLEALFGEKGAYGGCWCMWFRMTQAEFSRQAGEGTKRAMRGIVDSGEVPGLLAYTDGEPIGWCSLGPRQAFGRLQRSRTLKAVDEQPVWSIVCFYVAAPYRGKGLMAALLKAAVEYAKSRGARVVEGYPVEVGDKELKGFDAYTGVVSAFRRAGFVEAARRSERQPVMRYYMEG